MAAREDDQARELQNLKRQKLREQQADLDADKAKKANTVRQQVQDLKNINNRRQNKTPNIPSKEQIKEEALNKYDLGLIGGVVWGMLFVCAVLLDGIDLTNGGLWVYFGGFILKFVFTVGVVFGNFLVTHDLIRSLTGRRALINYVILIVENIGALNTLPFHIATVIITVIDLKTNFLSFVKYFKDSEEVVKKYINKHIAREQ